MIRECTTHKEIYYELAADLKKVELRMEQLYPKAIKEFKKEKKFPAWRWYEYNIPSSGNEYIIFFYAESRFRIETPTQDYFGIDYDGHKRLIIKGYTDIYQRDFESKPYAIRAIDAFTNHFLERYKERCLKNENLSTNDIACIFFSRNRGERTSIEITKEINRRIEKYGPHAQIGFKITDGFCFAQSAVVGEIDESGDHSKDKAEARISIFTTFMDTQSLADTQINAINKGREDAWENMFEIFAKEAKNGILSLKLDQ
ncbi:MAG: hypothetical protein IKY76_02690 [Alistipes sp.]|nr:hypothetical protein [Alistipes sp.]